MRRNKWLVFLSLVLLISLLAGCGGSGGDALKGTWEEKGGEIDFTFKFDGKGGVKVENEYGLNSDGSYTIDGDSVNIDIPDWDGVPEFKFSLDGKGVRTFSWTIKPSMSSPNHAAISPRLSRY